MGKIVYREKPKEVSWNSIHECLWAAHAPNRANNINMSFSKLTGEKLKEKVEKGNGKIFVAFDVDKIIGTSAYTIENRNRWFCNEKYAYICLDGVLPEYTGNGIYKNLYLYREIEIRKKNIRVVVFETHEKNKRMRTIQERHGFKLVGYKKCNDGHFNVIMAKWIDGCPFSNYYIKYRYLLNYLKVKLHSIINNAN